MKKIFYVLSAALLVILIAVQLPRINATTESSKTSEQETLAPETPPSTLPESEEYPETAAVSGADEEEIEKLMSTVEVE